MEVVRMLERAFNLPQPEFTTAIVVGWRILHTLACGQLLALGLAIVQTWNPQGKLEVFVLSVIWIYSAAYLVRTTVDWLPGGILDIACRTSELIRRSRPPDSNDIDYMEALLGSLLWSPSWMRGLFKARALTSAQ